MDDILKQLETNRVYYSELIRENARLTVQHEADLQVINGLSDQTEQLSGELQEANARAEALDESTTMAQSAFAAKAIETVHFLMGGGDPCTVCIKSCKMGEDCKGPLWTEAVQPAERAGCRQ